MYWCRGYRSSALCFKILAMGWVLDALSLGRLASRLHCRAGVYLLATVSSCSVFGVEVLPRSRQRHRYLFDWMHWVHLQSVSMVASRVLINLPQSCSRRAGKWVVWWLVARQNVQEGASSIVFIDDCREYYCCVQWCCWCHIDIAVVMVVVRDPACGDSGRDEDPTRS